MLGPYDDTNSHVFFQFTHTLMSKINYNLCVIFRTWMTYGTSDDFFIQVNANFDIGRRLVSLKIVAYHHQCHFFWFPNYLLVFPICLLLDVWMYIYVIALSMYYSITVHFESTSCSNIHERNQFINKLNHSKGWHFVLIRWQSRNKK